MQFSLQTLMLSFIVVAAAVSLGGLWGILIAAILLSCAGYIRMAKDRSKAWANLIIIIILSCCGIGILMPRIGSISPGRRAGCLNNQKNITLALLCYESEHGHYPPAYIADASGKPMHSWRILILPYLGRKDIFDSYDFNEPWDGPNNKKLAAIDLKIFQCPSDSSKNRGRTNYVAVKGPKTAWPGEKTASTITISACDGTSETILLMEVPNSDISWLEPRDLSFEELCSRMTPEERRDLFNAHNGHSQVSFADGHQSVFSDRFLEKNIQAMLTINGGEKIDMDDPGPSLNAQLNAKSPLWSKFLCADLWSKFLSVAIMVGTTLIIIYRPLPKSNVNPLDQEEEIRFEDTSEPET